MSFLVVLTKLLTKFLGREDPSFTHDPITIKKIYIYYIIYITTLNCQLQTRKFDNTKANTRILFMASHQLLQFVVKMGYL